MRNRRFRGAFPVREPGERGTFLLAGAVFLAIFVLVAAFGVDLSRYFYRLGRMQKLADGAALTGAQALDQFRARPRQSNAYRAVLNYINEHQGPEYRDRYTVYSDTQVEGVYLSGFTDEDGDSAYRIGVVVRDQFDPVFMPSAFFGRDTQALHVRAVAEADPQYSRQYWSEIHSTKPDPYPPLRYAIYSEKYVKPETMDCFQVGGDIHANDGYVKIEEMTGDGCGTGESVRIRGNVEAGAPGDGSGDVALENVTGGIEGDVIHAGNYKNENGPDVESEVRGEDPLDTPLIVPPTPGEEPSQYPGPICVFPGDLTVNDFGSDLGECSSGGTIHVKGNLKISGRSTRGNYSFVGEGEVKFEDVPDLTSNRMFVYSVNENVKFEKVNDAEINASIYAPTSEVKWETSSNVTINGSVVAGVMVKLETTGYMRINYHNDADLMPEPLVREGAHPDPIPDYYRVYLVD